MEFGFIEVDPQTALDLLEKNVSNRPIKDKLISRYANDMIENRWRENTGESIKFSIKDTLIDGQHRLLAVIRANVKVKFMAVYNLEEDVFDILDSGVARNGRDLFSIHGISYSSILPSIFNAWYELKNISNKEKKFSQRTLTSAEQIIIYNENPDYWNEVARKSYTWYDRISKIISPTIIGSMYAFFNEIDQEDANIFFDELSDLMVNNHKPIVLLRTVLMKNRLSTKKLTVGVKMALIIKAWNNFRKRNNSISFLKYDPKKEKMPIAV